MHYPESPKVNDYPVHNTIKQLCRVSMYYLAYSNIQHYVSLIFQMFTCTLRSGWQSFSVLNRPSSTRTVSPLLPALCRLMPRKETSFLRKYLISVNATLG